MRASALHHIDVFNRDRTAVAEIDHQDGEPDRGFRGRDREHEQCVDLPDDVAEMRRERDQIDIDREQDQLDRHQNNDDVLAVEKDAEDPEREQDRRDRKIMPKADGHGRLSIPWPDRTLTISIDMAGVRAFCVGISWRRTRTLCCKVSTMAPIMATSRIMPAAWKK